MKTEVIDRELFVRVEGRTIPTPQALTQARRQTTEREAVADGLERSLSDAKAEHRRALLAGEDTDRGHIEELAQRLEAARDALADARRHVTDIEAAVDRHRATQIEQQAQASLTDALSPFYTRKFT